MNKKLIQKISNTLKEKYATGKIKSWNKGKKSSIETRKKQSKTMKKLYKLGKIKSWNKGKKSSIETRKKQSIGIKNNLPKTSFKKGHIPANFNGGKYKNTIGYIMILNKNHPNTNCRGYVREHILIMEKHLKRYLNKKESVHHINEIKSDNRIENLLLFKNESEHQKYHHKKLK